MSKKTIYIAGLGLIGGSLALGIKRDHPDYEILGYNRSDYSRNIALERGIVDRARGDFKEFACGRHYLSSANQANGGLLEGVG